MAFAAANRIDWYTSSDQNVIDFWTNIVKPKFEAANPGVTINLVDGGDNAGLQAIASRALAALGTNSDPQADFFEGFDARQPVGALDKGLWVDFAKENLSNYSKINPLAFKIDNLAEPALSRLAGAARLRHHQARSGQGAEDLGRPGRLDQGQPRPVHLQPPDKGGSGGNFVRRAIYAANGKDPSLFKVDNYTQAKGDEMLGKAWEILKDLAPSLMDQGAYTSGNTQSIQLLVAERRDDDPGVVGSVAVGDRAGRAAGDHRPGAAQRSRLPGRLRPHHRADQRRQQGAGAQARRLHPERGDPVGRADRTRRLPGRVVGLCRPELHDKYKDLIPTSIPVFPGGDWDKAINDGWYRNVAPNVDRSK